MSPRVPIVHDPNKRCARCGVTDPRCGFPENTRRKGLISEYCVKCRSIISHQEYDRRRRPRVVMAEEGSHYTSPVASPGEIECGIDGCDLIYLDADKLDEHRRMRHGGKP